MGDFDDINIKIAVDAAGAESGLNAFSSAIDKVSENIAGLGEGIDFSDAITREVLAATNDIENLDAVIQGVIEGISAESIDIAVGVDAEGASDYLAEVDESIQQTIENAENLQFAIDAALGSATGQAFAIDLDISEAQETLADLGSAIDAAAASGFIIPADVDISQAESAMDELSETMANIPAGMDLSGTVDSLAGVDSALQETTENAESLGDALGAPMSAPFVVTAGDITDALDSITSKIQEAESSIAGFNKVSAGIEQISGISADAAKQLAISISDEDMSIQGALESQKILSKQHVDSITQMEEILDSWKAFSNANDEQAASLQEKLIPAWNQFGISADEQSQYFGALTTLFQETTLSSSDFANSIMRTGKPLSDLGLSLDQVAKLYLTMEESGLVGRKGMAALSGAITDINKAAEETGAAIPKGNEAYAELIKQMDITPDKVNAANTAFEKSTTAVDRWSEAMDKGDTSSEKLGAQIAKVTAGFEEMVVPLAPAATGVATIAGVGAQLAIFDAFLGGGRLKGGLDAVISKLPLIGTAAAGITPEVAGATGALSLLGGPVTIGLLAAAGGAVAAYATNFGGFADNINDAVTKAQASIEEFGAGNYEEAGELAAKSLVDGFEALGDLLSEVVRNLPELKVDADKLFKGLKEGLKTAAKSAGEELRLSLEVYLKNASVDVESFCKKIEDAIKNHPWDALGGLINSAIVDPFNSATADVKGFISGIESGIKTNDWSTVGKYINDAITGELNKLLPFGLGDVASEMIKGIVTPSPTVKTGENELAQTKVGTGGFTYGGKTTTTTPSPANPWMAVPSTTSGDKLSVTTSIDTESIKSLSDALLERGVSPELAADRESALNLAKTFGLNIDASGNVIKSNEELEKSTKENSSSIDELSKSNNKIVESQSKAASVSAPSSGAIFSGGPGSQYAIDPFTVDPASYFKERIQKDAERAGYATIPEFESYLNQFGKTLNDKASEYFSEEKSEGFGGNWDLNEWTAEAMKGVSGISQYQSEFNSEIKSGADALSIAYKQLEEYNKSILSNSNTSQLAQSQSLDMMNAMQQANQLQQLYTDAMKDGTVSGDELTGIQSQQTAVQDALTAASTLATDATGKLPAALSSVADAINSIVSQIYSKLAEATSAASQAQATAQKVITFGEATNAPTTPEVSTSKKSAVLNPGGYSLAKTAQTQTTSEQQPKQVVFNQYLDMKGSRIDSSSVKNIPVSVAKATKSALGRAGRA